MHCFRNKFSKIAKRLWLSAPQRPLTFNIGDLNLRTLVKLWILSCLWKNWTSRKIT